MRQQETKGGYKTIGDNTDETRGEGRIGDHNERGMETGGEERR